MLEGVKAGEEVVTSAQFLLDSESKLREATAKMMGRLSEVATGNTDMSSEVMDHSLMNHEGMNHEGMNHEGMNLAPMEMPSDKNMSHDRSMKEHDTMPGDGAHRHD